MLEKPPGNDALRVVPSPYDRFGPPDSNQSLTRLPPAAERFDSVAGRAEKLQAEIVAMQTQGFGRSASASPRPLRREGETTGEIHILPHGSALSREAVAVLERSIETGQDLGSRRQHIQALEASLVVSQAELRRRAELIRGLGPDLGFDLEELYPDLGFDLEELYQEFMRYADAVGRLSSALLSNLPALPDDGEPPIDRG